MLSFLSSPDVVAEQAGEDTSSKRKNYFSLERSAGSIAELDGLRGIAILLVLFRHSARPFFSVKQASIPVAGWDMLTPAANGWMGVDLFYVLSGFLISYHVLRQAEPFARSSLRKYFLRRILRIVPTYYAVIAICAAGLIPLFDPFPQGITSAIWTDIFFLSDYYRSSIIVAFWSIGVEEKFYAVAPFFLYFLTRLQNNAARWRMLALFFFVPLIGRILTYDATPGILNYVDSFWVLRSPFHLCFDTMVIGTTCAFIYRDRQVLQWTQNERVVRMLFWIGVGLIALLLVPFPILEGQINIFNGTLVFSLIALGFGLIVLGAVLLQDKLRLGFLRSKFLLYFSKISYSLYLIHLAFLNGLGIFLQQVLNLRSWPLWAQYALYAPLFFLISIVSATLLHLVVEKPFLLLKDRIR